MLIYSTAPMIFEFLDLFDLDFKGEHWLAIHLSFNSGLVCIDSYTIGLGDVVKDVGEYGTAVCKHQVCQEAVYIVLSSTSVLECCGINQSDIYLANSSLEIVGFGSVHCWLSHSFAWNNWMMIARGERFSPATIKMQFYILWHSCLCLLTGGLKNDVLTF